MNDAAAGDVTASKPASRPSSPFNSSQPDSSNTNPMMVNKNNGHGNGYNSSFSSTTSTTFATPRPSGSAQASTNGLSSVHQIQLPAGSHVDLLPRGKTDPTVRLASLPANLDESTTWARPGMFIMAAVQGRTRISFYKLPETVVRKELDRLEQSGNEFGLVLTFAPPTASTPSTAQSQSVVRPFHPPMSASSVATPRSHAQAYSTAPHPSSNIDRAFSSQRPALSSVAKQPEREVNPLGRPATETINDFPIQPEDGYDEEEDERMFSSLPANMSVMSANMVDKAFMESVERLRSQRRAVEMIKRDSQQKSLKIESLSAELKQVQAELEQTREAYESLRRNALTNQVVEDALNYERSRNAELERLVDDLRSEANLANSRFSEEITRLKTQKEEERVALQNALEETRLQHSESLKRIEELRKSLDQINTEREASEAREEQTRRVFDRLQAEMKEHEIKSEHTLERTRVERDKAQRRCEELESQLAVFRGQTSALKESSETTRDRLGLLERTVAELEENNRELRMQLGEKESKLQSRVREYEMELERLKRELSNVIDVKEESRKAREELRAALDEEIRSHRASREEMVMMEASKRESEEACERALRQSKLLNDRLNEMQHQKDVLHDRLVRALAKGNALADELEEERRAAKALAETRLDLLAQFVEEERRLDGTLMTASHLTIPAATTTATGRRPRGTERKLEFASPTKHGQQQRDRDATFLRRNVLETPDVLYRSGIKGLKQLT